MRTTSAIALGLAAALCAVPSARAQSISGTLLSAATEEPLPYATVVLGDSSRGRFANAAGRFFLTGLARGTYHLRARQIGFFPLDTTIAVGDAPVQIVLHLSPSPLRLATMPVTARRLGKCVATGIPDSTVNPQLASVFSQLRNNVDRYRILLDEYPFHYRREERRFVHAEEGHDSTETLDTVSYYSRDRRPYRVGDVVYEEMSVGGGHEQKMYIPTFRDLADTAFQGAHCFSFAGEDHGAIRIDFQPASHITAPDIEGSIYLDAHRSIIRRAVFRLTRPAAVVPPVLGLTVTTTFAEIVPLVPVVGSTHTEQPLSPVRVRASAVDPSMPAEFHMASRDVIEDDRLLDHTFDGEGLSASAPPARAPPTPPPPPAVATAGGCSLPPAVDTVAVFIYGTLTGGRPVDPGADSVLRTIQRAFHLANGLSFPVFRVLNGGSSIAATPTGEVSFAIGRGGRLTDIRLAATSLSSVVDSSLIGAVRQVDSARALGESSSGSYTLSLSSVTSPESARVATLGRIEVPVWHLTQRASIDADSPAADLPPGSGTFEFVVDEHGRAIPATLQVLSESEPRFAAAVARVLPDLRFYPARIGQCPVKQLMHQPFSVHPLRRER